MAMKVLILLFWVTIGLFQTGCDAGGTGDEDVAGTVAPVLTLAPFSVIESSSSTFPITLNRAMPVPVSFFWTISQISAPTAGRFSSLSGSATIPAGTTAYNVPMPVINDNVYLGNQDFKITLSTVSNGVSVPTTNVVFTLVDDETLPKVGFAVASVTTPEATASETVTITLSNPSTSTVTANFSLGGTASAITDYSVSPVSSVTFSPGQTSQTVNLTVVNDNVSEPDETVLLTLTTVTNGTVDSSRATHILTIANDDFAPYVTNVTSAQANGNYRTGTIPIKVQFSEAMNVTGTPLLKLETGSVDQSAVYVSGSGTTDLIFNYTIQAGDLTADLDYFSTTALSLNAGTIRSVATGIDATLMLAAPGTAGSLGSNRNFVIDTISPNVTNITSVTADGDYKAGVVIGVSISFDKIVYVVGNPTFLLETGTTDRNATYVSGSGSTTLVFSYTVQPGDTSSDLDEQSANALSLNGGTIRDVSGNDASLTVAVPGASGSLGYNKNFIIDTTPPTVTSVTSAIANGAYKAGSTIDITVAFSETVWVSGSPRLQLETGTVDEYAAYNSGSGTSTLTFRYIVSAGDRATDLDYLSNIALTYNGGNIYDGATNSATLVLPAVGAAGSLGANKNIIIDTDLPTTPSSVADGTWSTTLTQAPAASWVGSTDATTAVNRYEYALGTSAGASDVVGWTSNALLLTRTQTGLALTEGTTYYASVRAVDTAGNISAVASGDGFRADVTLPSTPATMDDGYTSSSLTQSPVLTWGASTDALSGLDHYEIAIGTSAGASNVSPWTSVGTVTTTTVTGLTLTEGATYYASVRAHDLAGNISAVRAGDGWTIGWLQQAYLKAVNGDVSDSFGYAVAISGDTMVVGVPNEASNATTITNGATASANNAAAAAGAVYVYVRSGTAWTQQAYIKAANSAAGDQFGASVAIDGDTIIVGAPAEDASVPGVSTTASTFRFSTDSGAAYVYKRTGTTWAMESYFKPTNVSAGMAFGASVAISADSAVVGSPKEASNTTGTATGTAGANTSLANAGAAYVFTRSGTTWTQQSYLKAAVARAVNFGAAVAISVDTIAVGAPLDSSNQQTITNGTGGSGNTTSANSGATAVFFRTGTVWAQQAYIKSSNSDPGDKFGSSLAVSGNLVVVGAPYESSNATGPSASSSTDNSSAASGAAYVYSRSGTTWSEQSYLKPANTTAGQHFGTSVAIEGTLALVGSPDENANNTAVIQGSTASSNQSAASAGAAYLYRVSGSTWSELAYLKAPNAEAGDAFGQSCAISGSSLAVGATLEDSNQTTITNGATASSNNANSASGAVYLFNR